jgi:hypothetical protein
MSIIDMGAMISSPMSFCKSQAMAASGTGTASSSALV